MSSATIDRPADEQNVNAPDDARDLTTDQPAAPVAVETAQVDPATLVLEVNVRAEAELTKEFLASIKQHGVLTPIRVARTQDGTLHVRAGQRRTLAAIEAGLHTIPAVIVDATDEATRIVEQVIENDQRRALSDTDRLDAYEQLSLTLGMTAGQIASATNTKRASVTAALKVVRSAPARSAFETYGLLTDEAAIIAEFDGDEDAVARLTALAEHDPQGLAHEAQRIRDARTRAAAREAFVKELTETGLTVVERPGYDEPGQELRLLMPAGSEAGSDPIAVEDHATCPGHAAFIELRYRDGATVPDPVFICTAPDTHGHLPRYTYMNHTQSAAPTPTTEERREVRNNNAAWRSAEVVRREWLATFAKRRTAPKDGAAFTAHMIASGAHYIEKAASAGHTLAATMLGLDGTKGLSGRDAINDLIENASPARTQHIALVLALCAYEASTDHHTWRNPNTISARYFTALEGWGYSTSDVEKICTKD